jgi:hypothetical protein
MIMKPPNCPSLDPRVNPHPAYVFGASFINMHGQHQVLAFKDPGVRQMILKAGKATGIKLLDLPGGVFKVADSDKN